MSSDGMEMTVQMKPRGKDENVEASMNELKSEVEDLRQLVHTLLTIIMEEADGIQSGLHQQFLISPSVVLACNPC